MCNEPPSNQHSASADLALKKLRNATFKIFGYLLLCVALWVAALCSFVLAAVSILAMNPLRGCAYALALVVSLVAAHIVRYLAETNIRETEKLIKDMECQFQQK